MNIKKEREQDCMRVCYNHWVKNSSQYRNSEEMSIITYAMLLDIINESNSSDNNLEHYIEQATLLYNQGLVNGWMKTH